MDLVLYAILNGSSAAALNHQLLGVQARHLQKPYSRCHIRSNSMSVRCSGEQLVVIPSPLRFAQIPAAFNLVENKRVKETGLSSGQF